MGPSLFEKVVLARTVLLYWFIGRDGEDETCDGEKAAQTYARGWSRRKVAEHGPSRTTSRPLRPPRSTLTLRLSDHTTSNPKVPGGDIDPSRIGYVRVHVRTPSILLGTVVELLVLMLLLMLMLILMMMR